VTVSEILERYRWFIVALFTVPLVSGVLLLAIDRIDNGPATLEVRDGDQSVADIRVDVSGAVQNPGVYPLPDGARWIDAIEAAGGATGDANLDAVNLATRVRDEDKIFVPTLGGPIAAGASSTPSPLVDINTASQSELEDLPGIGEVRAAAIIRSRETDGPYNTTQDLLTREVIPEFVFEDIADLITTAP
jgi:competence protein ComEA